MEPDRSLSIAVAPELNVNLQEAGRARSSTRHLALPQGSVQQCHPSEGRQDGVVSFVECNRAS